MVLNFKYPQHRNGAWKTQFAKTRNAGKSLSIGSIAAAIQAGKIKSRSFALIAEPLMVTL